MHKQDASLYIQDVCYSVKCADILYVEVFPCLQCNKRPLLRNYIVDTVDFKSTVGEICKFKNVQHL